ncbi:hypothetical protein O1611_g4816 [Lasiodiplodia mahajangana]|uniref:Uncharacterized protein n=1 Tax=Lasiodiplodia mahajangana TaxID=1108764 RepID=A0ACC2JN14_9PEZI|nr:hypothetical protein O1611_g4816 [Lasiodiplodia mahajangana]
MSMDFLNELESMAEVAIQQSEQPVEPDHSGIQRWQLLFGFSYSQALKELLDHRSDLSRPRVSEAHWEMVRAEKEAQGYNKEAYEYSSNIKAPKSSTIQTRVDNQTYLLRLDGPINNLEAVKIASQLKEDPPIYQGTDDDEMPATFCKIDTAARNNILAYLSETESRFQPTFVRCSVADKQLSATSSYPTLGSDSTMPQNRPSSRDDPCLLPSQTQYPVWYFFYGTLADAVVISRLLGVDPAYEEASVQGGALKTWGGKYKALVDSPGGVVHGNAFLVQNRDQEEALRCYETERYEVVRCELNIGPQKVRGLTFRFVDDT